MMRRSKKNKKKSRRVKIARISILITTITICITTIIMLTEKNFKTKDLVNAAATEQTESVKVDKQENNLPSSQSTSLEKDPSADDIASVEKYLNQQSKGIMPDGADGKKVVYLTFDDGPSETVTPNILDTLKQENVKATFFLVGKAIDKNQNTKNLVKREVTEGNAIGNHTYSHDYKYLYPNRTVNVDNFMADIKKTNASISDAIGQDFSTRAIRFPGGHMSWKGMAPMDKILADKDYHQVDWNALSKDAEGKHKNANELLQEVIKTVKGREKTIILMHDTYGKEETAKALPEIIHYLKAQGYEFRIMK